MTETKERYHGMRSRLIAMLGGKCVECGATESLEIDHIDPAQKSFNVSRIWAYTFETVLAELKKCQLLCESCHRAKHAVAKGTHGTLSAFRHCKCDECRAAKASYMKEYRAARRKGPLRPTGQRAPCGTRASYRYCKCSLCRAAQADYMRDLRARKTIRAAC